tara:strand:+ start:47 stop:511 length:465 start_codon:yes stop_codon:yes gene_type:complete
MATRTIPAALTVTIKESYTLNETEFGNQTLKTFDDNSKVEQRIMEVNSMGDGTVWTGIMDLSAADSAGNVIQVDFKYFRVTNLDDTSNLNLRFYNGVDYLILAILPEASIVLMDASVDATTASVAATFADIQSIEGQSSDASDGVDIEFIIVTS